MKNYWEIEGIEKRFDTLHKAKQFILSNINTLQALLYDEMTIIRVKNNLFYASIHYNVIDQKFVTFNKIIKLTPKLTNTQLHNLDKLCNEKKVITVYEENIIYKALWALKQPIGRKDGTSMYLFKIDDTYFQTGPAKQCNNCMYIYNVEKYTKLFKPLFYHRVNCSANLLRHFFSKSEKNRLRKIFKDLINETNHQG